MDVTLADPGLANFIARQAPGTLSFTQAWLNIILQPYGYKTIPLITTNKSGNVSGFLPLCAMQSVLTGRRLVSVPFSDECPFLAEDETSASTLVDQAIELAREQKAKYLELRTGINEVLAQRTDLVESNLYVRWIVPLSTPEMNWKALRKNVQQKVNKSKRLGVQVRVARSREEIEHYYRLHLLTRSKKHGMPSQPRRFFYSLWDAFASNEKMQLLLAEHQGTVIASVILLAFGSSMRYAYSASDDRYLNLAPNNLLTWTAITMGCEQGYQTLDLGRTARDNEGLMEYKRHWGALEEPLPYYYYPNIAGLASTSENSWKYRLLTSCWKKLPLPVTSALGGHLYKHLG
jgi:FemAB-related protein (PEP-CTERM system-associated)